nr:MAG TPA: hypothetical protein [Caudoviricetes sp.]
MLNSSRYYYNCSIKWIKKRTPLLLVTESAF